MTQKIRTYVGRRLNGKKLTHYFKDDEGGMWSYPKAKASNFYGAKIGKIYDLTDGLPDIW